MTNHTLADIHALMDAREALIIHFSTCPKMLSSGRPISYFPHDLNHLISGGRPPLSCCIVAATQVWDMARRDCNIPGSVGVIIGLRTEKSVLSASNSDCGSDDNVKRQLIAAGAVASLQDIDASLSRTTGYGELIVHDYDVQGLFVAPSRYLHIDTPAGPDVTGTHGIILPQLHDSRSYTFNSGQVWQIRPEPQRVRPSTLS